MRYITAGGLLLIAAGALAALGWLGGPADVEKHPPRIPPYAWDEMRSIYAQQATLEEARQASRSFCLQLERLKAQFFDQERSLAEVVDELRRAAREDNPLFLSRFPLDWPGSTEREKVALVLLGHLSDDVRTGIIPLERADIVEQLRCELESWPDLTPATRRHLTSAPEMLETWQQTPRP